MQDIKIRPVILSGGSGTRLWPVSRQHSPKQFIPLTGEETLFSATLARVSDRSRYAAPMIVGNHENRFLIRHALAQAGIEDAIILLEPCARNTAAAALVAAFSEPDKRILHLLMPSDHVIQGEAAFHAAVAQAAITAMKDKIVLFGITPTRAETGYGYIIAGIPLEDLPARQVMHFCEKPHAEKAALLISQGALWNSGMFLCAPDLLCREAQMLAPQHYHHCTQAVQDATSKGNETLLAEHHYELMKSHALDTLIIEQTAHAAVLPCDPGWDDVGCWHSLSQHCAKDENANSILGAAVLQDTQSCYIRSEGPTIAAIGMKDCIIIATNDGVLVTPHDRAQDIKSLMGSLNQLNASLTLHHPRVPRPWGWYESLLKGKLFHVKQLNIRPGEAISLQIHEHRSEHWIVVAGTAMVECEGEEKAFCANDHIFIDKNQSHRLSNRGATALELIEVQFGHYLGEDDLVRLEDQYGRGSPKKAKIPVD